MSNEQNLDDVLQRLKDFVSTPDTQTPSQPYFAQDKQVNQEELEKQLKEQYLDGNSSQEASSYEPEREYVISDEFLSDIEDKEDVGIELESTEENIEEDIEEEPEEEPEDSFENNIDDVIIYEAQEESFEEEAVEPYEDESFEPQVDITSVLLDLNSEGMESEPVPVEEEAMLVFEEQSEDILLEDEAAESDETTLDGEEYESIVFANDEPEELTESEDELELTEEKEQVSEVPAEENKHHETFLASMRKTGMDFTTDDIYRADAQKNMSAQSDEITKDERAEVGIIDGEIDPDELDLSTINIMMQFCEKEELEDTIGDTKVEEFLVFEQTHGVEHHICDEALDGDEYISESQNQAIYDSYKKSTSSALLTAVSCGIISLVAIIFDLLPIAGTEISGLLDYVKYPVVYALIGLQFVVFTAAICYKKLWNGLKRACSLTPNTYSVVAIILSLTVLYDIIIVIVLACTNDELPPMYNGIAALITAVVMLSDYFDVYSESRIFNVYSASSNKYTLTRESEKSPIGAKLYNGGLESVKKVYSANSVEFPRGFFRGLNAPTKRYFILAVSVIPVVVIGMIAAVVSVVMGTDAYASCAAFMIALFTLLPIILIFSDSLQNLIATVKLTESGSAYIGKNAIEKYADCDILVFRDNHLLKQINTDSVGFAVYDTTVGYLVLGCLDTLFKYIGGPLSGIKFDAVPDVFRFNNVQINKMARNGIDAVIENKHSLLVGDHEFMSRYGLSFPTSDTDNGRSTLCVALNGKVTAKLSIKYTTEPIFEMLAERLYAEGVCVAVTTADPLISSKTISDNRTIGDSPISVIHKGVEEILAAKGSNFTEESDGVLACQSRLKLAAVVVWIKKLARLRRINTILAAVFSAVGMISLILLIATDTMGFINQSHIMAYLVIELGAAVGITVAMVPNKHYFTVEGLYKELEQKHMKEQKKAQKKSDKQEK